jgi:hypothetical protein
VKWLSAKARQQKEYERVKEWHLWFAWRPICLGEYWYWLEFLNRRADPIHWRQTNSIQYWYKELV